MKSVNFDGDDGAALGDQEASTTEIIHAVSGKIGGSQISEDERDAEIQRRMLEKKKNKAGKKGIRKRVGSMFAGQDIYLAMVKKTQYTIREMNEINKGGDHSTSVAKLQNKSSFVGHRRSKAQRREQAKQQQNEKNQNIKAQPSQNNIKMGKHTGGRKKRIKKKKEEEHPDQIFENNKKKNEEEEDVEKKDTSSEESQTHSEEDEEERAIRKKKQREERKKQEEMRIKGVLDMSNDELEERKKQFYKTIQSKNWGKILVSSIVGIVFTAYFV